MRVTFRVSREQNEEVDPTRSGFTDTMNVHEKTIAFKLPNVPLYPIKPRQRHSELNTTAL